MMAAAAFAQITSAAPPSASPVSNRAGNRLTVAVFNTVNATKATRFSQWIGKNFNASNAKSNLTKNLVLISKILEQGPVTESQVFPREHSLMYPKGEKITFVAALKNALADYNAMIEVMDKKGVDPGSSANIAYLRDSLMMMQESTYNQKDF
jgi:hypothetical protein